MPDGLGKFKTPDVWKSVQDGLWRPGGAFFQIGFGWVKIHNGVPATVTLTKAFPVRKTLTFSLLTSCHDGGGLDSQC